MSGIFKIPEPRNEVCRSYVAGSEDRKKLEAALEKLKEVQEVPLIIGGKEVKSDKQNNQICPGDKNRVLCKYHMANEELIKQAIEAALKAKEAWETMDYNFRLAVFLKAADLLTGKYRYDMLAACMLGQGKTVWQAEIDAIAETADFLRFNPKYAEQIYSVQPALNSPGCWNRVEYRPLEGFIWALTPFNFTSIGANLCSSPAMMGNVVVWKPASSAVYSNYLMMKIFQEAGLPDGVINFVPGSGSMMSKVILEHPSFAGFHFTGSTEVFNSLSKTIYSNLEKYKSYPRIVGETGGKDFHFIHESCDILNAVNNTIRGAFEYQGQKCSACSRVYLPDSISDEFLKKLESQMKRIKLGKPEDFSTYVTAVIDKASYDKLKKAIDDAKESKDAEVRIGGTCNETEGFYIEPTVIIAKDPQYVTMREELFGPVLTIYIYDAKKDDEALELCNTTSAYGLTGSIFAKDALWIQKATKKLRNCAGNFYINDKCTGAVVGQQPFGGARASGTNDKAGEKWNLLRWVSTRAIKENYVPLTDFGYPYMGDY